MNFIAEDSLFTTGDMILPAVLLVGFVIAVTIGVLIWRTMLREQQAMEKKHDQGDARR